MEYNGALPSDSHTAQRLEHATAEHLHRTTVRTFIGPLPEGWLKSHRKQWYRGYVLGAYKRVPTFTAVETASTGDASNEQAASPTAEASTSRAREPAQSSDRCLVRGAVSSTTSLLRPSAQSSLAPHSPEILGQREARIERAETDGQEPPKPADDGQDESQPRRQKVRFSEVSRLQLRARAQRLATKGTFRAADTKEGEMLKLDKMLVRIDITQQSLRSDYDEKVSLAVETKSTHKWREFMVVARSHAELDALAVLQLYKTRVIAASDSDKVKRKPKVEILLSKQTINVNLYSALDKTLCIWTTKNSRTTIYYLRPQSGASAVEWLTFLTGILGSKRANTLQVNVPDLSVSMRLDDPFKVLGDTETLAAAAQGDDEALVRAMSDERGAAGAIVSRCIDMLRESPEWADVLKSWSQHDRIGLAWKRYDRLEWVFGAVEQRMYGTIAMQRTHDLELRPKHHYPSTAKRGIDDVLEEPPPVEGFLIRLTSQHGQERKLGKMLFKRLYFTSQDQYLIFLRPAKAVPPRPPRKSKPTDSENVPTTAELTSKLPLSYEINPYPLDGREIAWLDKAGVVGAKDIEILDQIAADEAQRNTQMCLACDGFINLCDVQKVRTFQRGALPVDEHVDDGSDVDFHGTLTDTGLADGGTTEVDEDRIMELLMKNGLIIRLQAYNKTTRDLWMGRLEQLAKYWSVRKKADMDLYKSTRQQNLKELGIDERAEGFVGQFAYKWEVGKSFASPSLYNMCGISQCRTIHLSGILFRKPRKHTTFTRCHVILSHGHLLIFQDLLRQSSGKRLTHTHHERVAAISLQGCYLYSGLLTADDLLYENRTFDANAPGHHALPRLYREDNWTSCDEDAMTTFVVWHAKSKAWFRSSRSVDDVARAEDDRQMQQQQRGEQPRPLVGGGRVKTKLTRVSQLGAKGRSVVFKARSRAERDHWVMAIQVEIERLAAQSEEVRIVTDEK